MGQLDKMAPKDVRALIREGKITGPTSIGIGNLDKSDFEMPFPFVKARFLFLGHAV